MKYGLIVYDYTDNIGDDILSYAVFRFIPQVDYYIDRESLDTFYPEVTEPIKTIMNGWYLHHKTNWPPSEYIEPLIIGAHFSVFDFLGIGHDYIEDEGKQYFIDHEPIGSRDTSTLEMLQEKGIQAYFSGCLTLTLKPFDDVKNTDEVICVDVSEEVLKRVESDYGRKPKTITHYVEVKDRGKTRNEKFCQVEEVLRMYQGARCVITTRLHVALPCLALGTPVLLIVKEDALDRLEDYTRYVNHCSEEAFLNGNFSYNISTPIPNPKNHIELAEDIEKKVRFFVDEPIRNIDLPDVTLFKKYWVEKSAREKQLIFHSRNKAEEELVGHRKVMDSIHAAIEWHKIDSEKKQALIESLEKELTDTREWVATLEGERDYLQKQSMKYKKRFERLTGLWLLKKIRKGLSK